MAIHKIHRCWFYTLGACSILAMVAIVLGALLVRHLQTYSFSLESQLQDTRVVRIPHEWVDSAQVSVSGFSMNQNTTEFGLEHAVQIHVSKLPPEEIGIRIKEETFINLSTNPIWSVRLALPPSGQILLTWSDFRRGLFEDAEYVVAFVKGQETRSHIISQLEKGSSADYSLFVDDIMMLASFSNQPNGTLTLTSKSERVTLTTDEYFLMIYSIPGSKAPTGGRVKYSGMVIQLQPKAPFVSCFNTTRQTVAICSLDEAAAAIEDRIRETHPKPPADLPSSDFAPQDVAIGASAAFDYYLVIESTPHLLGGRNWSQFSQLGGLQLRLEEHGRIRVYASVFAPFGSALVFSVILMLGLICHHKRKQRLQRRAEEERLQLYQEGLDYFDKMEALEVYEHSPLLHRSEE